MQVRRHRDKAVAWELDSVEELLGISALYKVSRRSQMQPVLFAYNVVLTSVTSWLSLTLSWRATQALFSANYVTCQWKNGTDKRLPRVVPQQRRFTPAAHVQVLTHKSETSTC